MTLLEAISPTSRALLNGGRTPVQNRGGVRVNLFRITSAIAVQAGRRHKVHLKKGTEPDNRTLCGIKLNTVQEDLSDCNCSRCLLITSKPVRSHRPRAIKRLNGRKISPQQTKLIE